MHLSTARRFNSRADEMFANIDFDAVARVNGGAVSQWFRDAVMHQLRRLDERQLLIGKHSDGHTYPLRTVKGVEHERSS